MSDKTAMRCLSCERLLNFTPIVTPIGRKLSDYYRPSQDLIVGIPKRMECSAGSSAHPFIIRSRSGGRVGSRTAGRTAARPRPGSTDDQNPSKEFSAGPIEVHCRADGVFGQDKGEVKESLFQTGHCGGGRVGEKAWQGKASRLIPHWTARIQHGSLLHMRSESVVRRMRFSARTRQVNLAFVVMVVLGPWCSARFGDPKEAPIPPGIDNPLGSRTGHRGLRVCSRIGWPSGAIDRDRRRSTCGRCRSA